MRLTQTDINELVDLLAVRIGPQLVAPQFKSMALQILRLLAKGEPLSIDQVAQATDYPHEQLSPLVALARQMGAIETDHAGLLVGAFGLSLPKTSHTLHINSTTLYAWCAIDTFFLPALLGATAEVSSRDPISGRAIQATVSPTEITRLDPQSTVLSVAVPGADTACGIVGRDGSFCSLTHFFESSDTADRWLAQTSGVIKLVPADQAFQLAQRLWIASFDILLAQS